MLYGKDAKISPLQFNDFSFIVCVLSKIMRASRMKNIQTFQKLRKSADKAHLPLFLVTCLSVFEKFDGPSKLLKHALGRYGSDITLNNDL